MYTLVYQNNKKYQGGVAPFAQAIGQRGQNNLITIYIYISYL